MKFEKIVADVVIYLKNGDTRYITSEEYNLRVSNLVREIQYICDNDIYLINDGEVVCSGGEISAFEITNYEELLKLEKDTKSEKEEN
ncbi:hypothetical protein PSYJYH_000002 [Bacillus phage PSYJ-YH]|nr:hypothetical protein PSYJYH_000002 [Bacillus phage PSYJ-YH]